MYPQVFEIRLDGDQSKRYYAGQVIEGRVVVVLGKDKVVRGIVIRLIGKGDVFWDTGIKHNNVFRETEYYVNTSCDLLIPEDGRSTVLHPGTYEYYFSLPLPTDIPSSIEGQHAFVRYSLEAAIQRPWKDDQVQETIIHVTSFYDLSTRPDTAEPASMQKEKHVGFNICQSGPIVFNFMIGKTGFVPGEYLQFGVEIRNTSTTRINRVHVSLKRQLNGHTKGESKSTQDKILRMNGPSAEVGGYMLWQDNFQVPPLAPSELLGCTIISLQYYIEVKLALEKWADLKFNMPIFIGTIPCSEKDGRKASESFDYLYTPIKTSSRKSSAGVSRKGSLVKSPITGEVFTYDDDTTWGDGALELDHAPPLTPTTPRGKPTGGISVPFTALLPLDISFFQHKPDHSQFFKCYEDSDYEFTTPHYRTTSANIFTKDDFNQPPRPHSNPGYHWGRSGCCDDDE